MPLCRIQLIAGGQYLLSQISWVGHRLAPL
jgi:hypothetical protein